MLLSAAAAWVWTSWFGELNRSINGFIPPFFAISICCFWYTTTSKIGILILIHDVMVHRVPDYLRFQPRCLELRLLVLELSRWVKTRGRSKVVLLPYDWFRLCSQLCLDMSAPICFTTIALLLSITCSCYRPQSGGCTRLNVLTNNTKRKRKPE